MAAIQAMQTNADGSLNITPGFAFTRANLLQYLQAIAANPALYQVGNQYSNPPQTINGAPQVVHNIGNVVTAIANLANQDITFQVEGPGGTALNVCIDGIVVPVNTIWDMLGWIMSVTRLNAPPNANSTGPNYYFPLLSLYARWCRLLSGRTNEMVSVTWLTDLHNNLHIVLGSTVGKPSMNAPWQSSMTAVEQKSMAKAGMIIRERQDFLDEVGFHPATAGQRVHDDGTGGTGGYGTCAETFAWILTATKVLVQHEAIPVANLHGYAMLPTTRHGGGDNVFIPATAAAALCPPCAVSCQPLFGQIYAGQNWRTGFGVGALKVANGLVAAPTDG